MSTPEPIDALRILRKAAGDARFAAGDRRRALFFDRGPREEYLEWSWIEQACKRELRRLNNLIARRVRAQQVPA